MGNWGKWIYSGIAALVVTTAASTFAAPPNVFGVDDRVAITSNDYPWRAIGALSNGCTATLVGPDLVLTAAHCVFDSNKNLLPLTFYPNLVDNQSSTSSAAKYTWWGTKTPETNRGQDWAIIRLNDRLGDSYGWMGTQNYTGTTVSLAGYSADFRNGKTGSVHQNCSIRERLLDTWLHDCDGTRGSSGGPIFVTPERNKTYIVGIQAAEYRNGGEVSLFLPQYERAHANIAVPASAFLSKLKEVLNDKE